MRQTIFFKTGLAVLCGLILTATGLWAAGADEGSTAAAADKQYVTDPSTGKVVVAPQYGGTITYARASDWPHADVYFHHHPGELVSGVVERLSIADWAFDRDVFSYRTTYLPDSIFRPHLAESWETPDATTIVFHIRKGVHWHDKEPMNGRELTAKDIEYNLHRYLGLGSGYTEPAAYYASWESTAQLPWESITATDEWTLVLKLTNADPGALGTILNSLLTFTYPPEVIEEHGDVKDWRNLVGTGPFELTDWTEGTSVTWTKNPDYWGYDEKYPENLLPYVDTLKALIIPDEATRMAALRSAKIDVLAHFLGGTQLSSTDQLDSLKKTDPELAMEPFSYRSLTSWPLNSSRPPFDDVRVCRAMQMALDLETINTLYWGGIADTTPQGWLGVGMQGYVTPFADWPEEVKGYYPMTRQGQKRCLMRLDIRAARTALD